VSWHCNHCDNSFFIIFFLGGEAIDWAVEISLCERCAERKTGNYHAWNHRQWVLQKATDLLSYDIIKTERYIRKNIADYSCYHHRHFVLTKLFDVQYYDVHDMNFKELYQFVNVARPEDGKINNLNDLAALLVPNTRLESVNAIKLNSFLYTLNLIAYDLKMLQELSETFGNYEAFNSYKRIIVKFALEIVQLANSSNYLHHERFTTVPSSTTPMLEIKEFPLARSVFIDVLMDVLKSDERNDDFVKIFF